MFQAFQCRLVQAIVHEMFEVEFQDCKMIIFKKLEIKLN